MLKFFFTTNYNYYGGHYVKDLCITAVLNKLCLHELENQTQNSVIFTIFIGICTLNIYIKKNICV